MQQYEHTSISTGGKSLLQLPYFLCLKSVLNPSARTAAAVPMPVCICTPTLIADTCVNPEPGNGEEEENQKRAEGPGVKVGGEKGK